MSDITYSQSTGNTVTFSDGDFAAPSGQSYALIWQTFAEQPARRAEAVHSFPGVDGIEVVDLGRRSRIYTMTGLIAAANEAGLEAGRDAIKAEQNADDGTLTAKGEAITYVDLVEFSFFRHVVSSTYHMQAFRLIWREGE